MRSTDMLLPYTGFNFLAYLVAAFVMLVTGAAGIFVSKTKGRHRRRGK